MKLTTTETTLFTISWKYPPIRRKDSKEFEYEANEQSWLFTDMLLIKVDRCQSSQ